MQQNIFTLLMIIGLYYSSTAQNHSSCDSSRYISEVFSDVDTTLAVLFGNNTTIGGNNKDLFMDIYEPSGDVVAERPVIMLAFGGSFIGGSRGDLQNLCIYYAKRGFIAVSIDYRLFDMIAFPNATNMTDVVIKAVSDMKAAIRFLTEDAATTNAYRIDPNLIFVGGISAGAIVANHTAYVDSTDILDPVVANSITANGGWQGNSSTNTQYSSAVHGVVNFSGALSSASFISAGESPLFSAHDDTDGTVPYADGMAKVFGFPIIYMEGSGTMHPRADSLGIVNELITIPASTGHVSYFGSGSIWQDSVQDASCNFLRDNIICPATIGIHQISQRLVQTKFYPNPASGDMTIEINDLSSDYDIVIYDNTGRQVFQKWDVNEEQFILNKQNFAAGMYFVHIQFHEPALAPVQSKIIFR
jgi:para-nitrobenzyl esterase